MSSKLNIIFLFVVITLTSCNAQQKDLKNQIKGNWAYRNPEGYYYEAYINNDSIIQYSYDEICEGPFNWSIKNDSLFYFNLSFKIELPDNNKLILRKNETVLLFERINIIEHEKNKIDRVFLRRCIYLMNKNIISVDSVFESIKEFEQFKNEKVTKKVIFSR